MDTLFNMMKRETGKQRDRTRERFSAAIVLDEHVSSDAYDDAVSGMAQLFRTFPHTGGKSFFDSEPYFCVNYKKEDDDDILRAYLQITYYPYFHGNNSEIYAWCLENINWADKDACNLSYDGKKLNFKVTVHSYDGCIDLVVSFSVDIPEEDEWMLRSIGKLQTREVPAYVEQCVVCK